MAERERLTKRERRERSRAERRRKEELAAKQTRRRRILGTLVAVAVVGGVIALLVLTREPPAEVGIVIEPQAVEEAAQAADCADPQLPTLEAGHLSEPAPPADELYPQRPTSTGPHFPTTSPVGAFDDPLDERFTTHNLEHGAVVAWFDAERTQTRDGGQIREWAQERNRAGFRGNAGTGIIAAPWDGELPNDAAVSLRAWGAAFDCARFDQTVADAFVIANFGTNGRAPERSFAPFPEGVLRFGEGAVNPAPSPPAATAPVTPPELVVTPTS